jgi:hypothetical protein
MDTTDTGTGIALAGTVRGSALAWDMDSVRVWVTVWGTAWADTTGMAGDSATEVMATVMVGTVATDIGRLAGDWAAGDSVLCITTVDISGIQTPTT